MVFDILQTALEIFCRGMKGIYHLLTIDPVTYQNGALWEKAMSIYNGLIGVGFTIILICGYIGIIGNLENLFDVARPSTIFVLFIMVTIAGGLLNATPYILRLMISFCQEIISKATGGEFAFANAWKIPEAIINKAEDLSTLMTVILWLVCFIGALVIIYSTFTIFLMAYGRIFKMYIYIAISPLCMSCIASRSTQRVALNFIKRFLICAGEGIIIIIAFMLFSAFTQITDTGELMSSAPLSEYEAIFEGIESIMQIGASPSKVVFTYVVQQSFFFILLLSIIKGSEHETEKIFGF